MPLPALATLPLVPDGTIARALPRLDPPAAAERALRGAAPASFELLVLAALLLATAAFGRTFSQLELGFDWLYPTEVVLVLVLAVALIRIGPREAWRRVAATGVLVPLGLFWALGALATVRGLADWGFSLTIEDIGLVEYSLLIPIVALIVSEREQLVWLASVVALGGILAIAAQVAALWTPLQWEVGDKLELVDVATGMYISLYVVWILSRLASKVSIPAWHLPFAILGVCLIVLGLARAAWLALIAGFLMAVVLALPGRRWIAGGAAAAALALGGALSVPAEGISFGEAPVIAQTQGSSGPKAANEITASFDPGAEGGQGANSAWRLAYWRYSMERAAKQPLNGAGFGTPANFTWSGITYDARTGDPADPFDVSPPHNSFVNVAYRMGPLALLALGAILVIAAWRLLPRTRRAQGEDRAISIWLLAALVVTFVVANFAVALEGPYMGIFFWTILGLTLLAPRVLYAPRP